MSESEDEPLGYLLHRLAAILRPQVGAALGPLELGLPEFVCLRILAAFPGRTSAQLARATHVSAQAMNQLLHRLEDIGAVTRPTSAPAGRALPAELTAEGRKLLQRAERAVQAADERVLDRLTPSEQRRLKALLRKAGAQEPSASNAVGTPFPKVQQPTRMQDRRIRRRGGSTQ